MSIIVHKENCFGQWCIGAQKKTQAQDKTMTAHNLKHSNAYFPFHRRCLRLFALCFANNTYSQCLSSPAKAKLKSQLSVSQMELSLSLHHP